MLEMGGYGSYVFSSYAIVLIGLAWLMFKEVKRGIAIRKKIKQDLTEKAK